MIDHVIAHRDDAAAALKCLAWHERLLLEKAAILYRIPPRIGTLAVLGLLNEWLASDIGGRRHEGASVALLRFAGAHLRSGWNEVESHHVNDPIPYDALCRENGTVKAVAEVKAQTVSPDHIRQLAGQMDGQFARRGYLFTRKAWQPEVGSEESLLVEDAQRNQDALGRRIDMIDVIEAAKLWLPLLDQSEAALPEFLRTLTGELDQNGNSADRRAFATLLEGL